MKEYRSLLEKKIRRATVAVASAREDVHAAIAIASVANEADVEEALRHMESGLITASFSASDASERLP